MYEKESVVRGHHVYKAIWTPFSNSLWVYTKVSCSSFFRLFLGKIDGLELERDIVRLARSLEGGGSASSHNSTLCTRKRANKSYPDPVAPGFYLLLVCSNPRALNEAGFYSREGSIRGYTVCVLVQAPLRVYYGFAECLISSQDQAPSSTIPVVIRA